MVDEKEEGVLEGGPLIKEPSSIPRSIGVVVQKLPNFERNFLSWRKETESEEEETEGRMS